MGKAVIENVVNIERPQVEVFDYASDHTHEMEWNPKMRSVRKLTQGPIGKGTRYEMEFIPGRPLVATCVGFDRPHRWEAVGDTLGMHISLGGEVSPTAAGSRLTLRTQFLASFPARAGASSNGTSHEARDAARRGDDQGHPGVG